MKNKRINLVAALTFGILALASTGANAQAVSTDLDEIEIITVKDASQENIFNEHVLNVSCPLTKRMSIPVSPRIRTTQKDCDCETGAAAPAPCDPCAEPEPCDPCAKADPCAEPEPCDVSPACPVPCEPCAKAAPVPVTNCDKNLGPLTSEAMPVDKDNLGRLQAYAYPRYWNLWGGNLESSANIFNNGSYADGTIISRGCDCGCNNSGLFNHNTATNYNNFGITGAAAGIGLGGIPVQNNPCLSMNPSIPVDNSAQAKASHGCPITVKSCSSIEVPTTALEKLDVQQVTGAAVPLINSYDDVPSGYWAADDINRLAASKVISGYPDQTFRPDRMVSRAEFTALAVSGLNYQGEKYYNKAIFSDVPQKHWANSVIDKGVNGGLVAGYPDGKFKPNNHVTRTEALVTLSKGLNMEMDDCKANEILSKYADGETIPAWARVSVAKALSADALKKSPDYDSMIRGNDYATRAEIAGMLSNIRVAMGIDPAEIACGCAETGAAAYVEVEKMLQYPTLKVKFDDQISAKDSQAGDGFRAHTTEAVTINGKNFPSGSIVRGKIVEVIRPSHNCKGGLKVVFTEIQNGDCKNALPQEVLSAKVLDTNNPNIISKIMKAPFTWAGAIVGNTARAVGNVVIQAGNGVEAVANDFGTGTGELFQGKVGASMRSYGQSALEVLKTPVNVATTAVSGVAGLAEVTVDEVAYVVSPDGTRISQISPKETVQIAFGNGTCPKTANNE